MAAPLPIQRAISEDVKSKIPLISTLICDEALSLEDIRLRLASQGTPLSFASARSLLNHMVFMGDVDHSQGRTCTTYRLKPKKDLKDLSAAFSKKTKLSVEILVRNSILSLRASERGSECTQTLILPVQLTDKNVTLSALLPFEDKLREMLAGKGKPVPSPRNLPREPRGSHITLESLVEAARRRVSSKKLR
jgi:hypothetical protein